MFFLQVNLKVPVSSKPTSSLRSLQGWSTSWVSHHVSIWLGTDAVKVGIVGNAKKGAHTAIHQVLVLTLCVFDNRMIQSRGPSLCFSHRSHRNCFNLTLCTYTLLNASRSCSLTDQALALEKLPFTFLKLPVDLSESYSTFTLREMLSLMFSIELSDIVNNLQLSSSHHLC